MPTGADILASPPEHWNPNESRTASNNAIGIVLFILSVFFVGLRVLARLRYQRQKIGLDDYLIFLGLTLNSGNLACCIAGGYYGLGKHVWANTARDMEMVTIITFGYVYIYAWSVCVIKYSIIALYRRIFGMSLLGWWCVFLTTAYLITNHIVLPLYCKPLNFYWNQWYPDAKGIVQVNEADFYLAIGIINLFGDICILSVPVRSVWKLNMSHHQKFAISFMFLLGGFVCFASMYRIITIVRLTQTVDISWAKSDVFIWSNVEPSIGTISACLPTLRGPLVHFLQAVFGYEPSSGASGGFPALPEIITISRKRTRPIQKKPLDETQITQVDEQEESALEQKWPSRFGRSHNQMPVLRPDEDKICLTTVIERKDNQSNARVEEESFKSSRDGIIVGKEVTWEESGV